MHSPRHIQSFLKFVRKKSYYSADQPLKRVWDVIRGDFANMAEKIRQIDNSEPFERPEPKFPAHADVVVIGGGLIGSAVAYAVQERVRDGFNVVVLEKDLKHTNASTVNSYLGMRQQYSLPENVLMSMYGANFLRNSKRLLGDDVNVRYFPHGNLVLADENIAETLEANFKIQRELGVKIEKLTKEKINERYPWINTKDVEFGCLGLENEGWFDAWALLWGLKRRAMQRGSLFFNAELIDFQVKNLQDVLMEGVKPGSYKSLDRLMVQHNGELKELDFCICVIAAGVDSPSILKLAGVGCAQGMLQIDFPIETRKRNAFFFENKNTSISEISTPMVREANGLWFKRQGYSNIFVAGRPYGNYNIDNDADYFHNEVLPCLVHRVPSFKDIELGATLTGVYDHNTFDENGIIGHHPYHDNIIMTSGFTAQGLQVAPAVGQAVSELILNGQFISIDLSRLGFDRFITNSPQYETDMV